MCSMSGVVLSDKVEKWPDCVCNVLVCFPKTPQPMRKKLSGVTDKGTGKSKKRAKWGYAGAHMMDKSV